MTTATLPEMASQIGVDPARLARWIDDMRPSVLRHLKDGCEFEVAVTKAHEEGVAFLNELLEGVTLRARVARRYTFAVTWFEKSGRSCKSAVTSYVLDGFEKDELIFAAKFLDALNSK